MKWWERKRREPPAPVVQVRQGKGQPFGALDRYVPLSSGEVELYRAIREGAPLVDAAIRTLVRRWCCPATAGMSLPCSVPIQSR